MSDLRPQSFRLAPIEGTPTRAFRCPACGRTFTRKDVMLRHQKRVTCKLNRLAPDDPHPLEKAHRKASKPPRGRPRNDDAPEAPPVHFPLPVSPANPQLPVSPSHTSPPTSPTQLSPTSASGRPFLPRSVSMDHRSLPLPAHPTPHIPARRESVPLPALTPSTTNDTIRQFAHELEQRTWPSHQAANYNWRSSSPQLVAVPPRPQVAQVLEDRSWHPAGNYELSSTRQAVTIPVPPRGVHPTQERWASRPPPAGQYTSFSPAFLEPFPVSVRPGVPSFPLVMG